ncbi:MAG TPA: ECF-type sigma factor [Phycisphaerales bacterium]|nr:ECF-type sigma factor [Phycisphaerales bacterium]
MPAGPANIPGEITTLLSDARDGRAGALDDLFAVVYDDLRALARQRFDGAAGRRAGLDGTALVHAACERLLGDGGRMLSAQNRRHFYFLFQRAMHDALVERVRAQSAQKRGGDRRQVQLIEFQADDATFAADILDLHEALEEFRQFDSEGTQVVMLRFFAGRSLEEAAEIMGCSFATARKHWDYARAWLHERLSRPRATE